MLTRNTIAEVETERNKGLFELMDQIEYRRIVSPEDFEDVGQLRLRAFNARPVYEKTFAEPLLEPIDYLPETFLYGLYMGGRIVASMRLNMLTAQSVETPALELFSDFLRPVLEQGMQFVDPSRFAVDPAASSEHPGLAILTHRLSTMMTIQQGAAYCLCAVKREHEGYYQRIFRATRLAGPFEPEGMCVTAVLLGISIHNADYIKARNPIFNFTETEARLLFETSPARLPPLTVLPTARLAARAA